MRIFKTEIVLFITSLTFVAFLFVAFAFYFSQFQSNVNQRVAEIQHEENYHPSNILMEPKPGSSDYGTSAQIEKGSVVKNSLTSLVDEYNDNTFQTYPFIFIKNIHLNESKKMKIAHIFFKMTGSSLNSFNVRTANWKMIYQMNDYSTFEKHMKTINQLIGGNSIYKPSKLHQFQDGKKLNYLEARHDYFQRIKVEKIGPSFARLFSDYFGIIILVFSIFPLTIYFSKEFRENCNDIIDLKTIPTWQYLGIKLLAASGVLYLITLGFSIFPAIQMNMVGRLLNLEVANFAFVKSVTIFVLPTILFISSFVLLCVQLVKPVISMIIEIIFSVLIVATTDISGYSTWSPLIRMNTYDQWKLFLQLKNTIYINRVSYVFVSIILFGLAVIIRSYRKRGVKFGG